MLTVPPGRSIEAGFARPVHDAQKTFRVVLDAFANPGLIHSIPFDIPEILTNSHPIATVAILLCLADVDTPLWFESSEPPHLHTYLRFHTGARVTSDPHIATFAVLSEVGSITFGSNELRAFNAGTALSPERSTTMIVGVPSMSGGAGAWLEGPGCDRPRLLAPAGFTAETWEQLADNHDSFPAGVDLLVTSGSYVVGIPRSTAITLDATTGGV